MTGISTLSLHDALPISADVDHPSVGRDGDAVRLAAGGEPGLDRPAGDHAGAAVVGVDRRLAVAAQQTRRPLDGDRKSTRLNSSHSQISYAVFCLKKKKP